MMAVMLLQSKTSHEVLPSWMCAGLMIASFLPVEAQTPQTHRISPRAHQACLPQQQLRSNPAAPLNHEIRALIFWAAAQLSLHCLQQVRLAQLLKDLMVRFSCHRQRRLQAAHRQLTAAVALQAPQLQAALHLVVILAFPQVAAAA